MKFPIISTIVATACAVAATAQAEIKVASVNVSELYTLFHKRFSVETILKDHEASIKQEIKEREDKLKAMQDEIKKIKERQDPTLSQAAMKKLRDELAAKVNEYQAAFQEYQSFAQRRSLAFREMQRRETITLLQEVQNTISDVTSKAGYDLVIDSSAVSPTQGTRVFPYVKPELNITEDVLKQLNAGAPEGFDPKAELERLYGSQQAPALPTEEAPAAN